MPIKNSDCRGNTRTVAILFLIVILTLTGGGMWYFMKEATSGPAPQNAASGGTAGMIAPPAGSGTPTAPAEAPKFTLWADAPSSAIAVAGVASPKQMMEQARVLIGQASAGNPQLDQLWRKAQGDMVSYFGVDPTDPAKLESLGIDPSQPMHLSVLEFGAKGEPTGAVLSIALSGEEQFLNFVKGVADREHVTLIEDTAGLPKVLRFPGAAVLAVLDRRAYVAGGPSDENLPAVLRKFIAEKQRSPILQAPGLIAALETVGGPGDATGYVDLKTIIEHAGSSIPKIIADFRSLTLKASASMNVASLNFAPGCRLVKVLKPGSSPREFIAKAGKPLAALSISLADPAELIRYIAQSSPRGDAGIAQFSQGLKQGTGLSFEDWGELLKDGHLGALAYKANTQPFFSLLVYVKLQQSNADRVQKAAAALQQLVTLIPRLVPPLAESRFVLGTNGDYVVFGNALDEIQALDGSPPAKWQPANTNSDILTLEAWPGEFAQHMQRVLPQVKIPIPAAAGKFTFALQQKGESIQYSTDRIEASSAMLGLVAAIAIPSLSRSRLAANEMAATAACKAYCEAQEIYHRTDYDNNGILEYSKTLRGLYETKPGAGDIGLIDRTFVDAEGGPSKNPIPKAGYCFKVLHGQGASATGGKRSYLVKRPDGNMCMTLGYALVAYPAKYDSTGRDTFIINSNGTLFQKDMGIGTNLIVESMTEFDPDRTWIPTQ